MYDFEIVLKENSLIPSTTGSLVQYGHEQKVVRLPVYMFNKKDSTPLLPVEAKMIADFLCKTLEPCWESVQESLSHVVDPSPWLNWVKSDGRKRIHQLKLDDNGSGDRPLLGDAIAAYEFVVEWFGHFDAADNGDSDSENDNDRPELMLKLTKEQKQQLSTLREAYEELEDTLVSLQRPGLVLTSSRNPDRYRLGYAGIIHTVPTQTSTAGARTPNLSRSSVHEESVSYRAPSSALADITAPADSQHILPSAASIKDDVSQWMKQYHMGQDHLTALQSGIAKASEDLKDDYFGGYALSALTSLKSVLADIGSEVDSRGSPLAF